MNPVSFLAVAAFLFGASLSFAADLSLTATPKSASVDLGSEVEVALSLKNGGAAAAEVPELIHDVRSGFLEIQFKGSTFEYARIHKDYFGFMIYKTNITEYLKKATLEPGKDAQLTLKFLLPEAGDYRIRGVYCGLANPLYSEWTDLKVKPKDGKTVVKVKMTTTLGVVKMSFRPDKALCTVINFINLVAGKYYDGVTFHRIIKGFMNQGGDPEGTGGGGPGYFIPQEFNNLPHAEGTMSMARIGFHVDTAGSQFFMCVKMMPEQERNLNRQYTVFGMIVEGLDVVNKINSIEADQRTGMPKEKPAIEKAEIVLE